MNYVGTPENLAKLRKQIDAVDEKLVALINERARLALAVGIAKGSHTPVHQPAREAAVLQHATEVSAGPLAKEGIETIFRTIIDVCRTLQHNK